MSVSGFVDRRVELSSLERAWLVKSAYGVDLPAGSTALALRLTDMLGEEVVVVLPATADA